MRRIDGRKRKRDAADKAARMVEKRHEAREA
jgi:hypothetical protein